ncbi:MAG: hypothetical protein ACK4WD_10735 [Flavobacteriales bacterium]|jgi:hypothetical protein
MKIDLIKLKHALIINLCFLLYSHTLHGQQEESETFDSTKHFVRGISFILKDSSGVVDTLFRELRYRTEITTAWDYSKNKWSTTSKLKNILYPTFPKYRSSQIESIIVQANLSLKNIILYTNCGGSYKEFQGLTPVISAIKEYCTPNSNCSCILKMTIENPQNKSQDIIFGLDE